MTDSVFSVDTMINLVQKLRQEIEEKAKFNQVKQKEDMTQATVKDCMERVKGEAKERFAVVEEEMIELIDKMPQHSLFCTVTRLKKTVDRIEEKE